MPDHSMWINLILAQTVEEYDLVPHFFAVEASKIQPQTTKQTTLVVIGMVKRLQKMHLKIFLTNLCRMEFHSFMNWIIPFPV